MTDRRIASWLGLLVLLFIFLSPTYSFSSETYRIKKGDTLSGISKKFGVPIHAIKEANNLKNSALRINQTLAIPVKSSKTSASKPRQVTSPQAVKETSYTVQKGDSLFKISRKTGVSVSDLQAINGMDGSKIRPGQKLALAYAETGGMMRPIPETIHGLDNFSLDDLEEIEDDAGAGDVVPNPEGTDMPVSFLGKWDDSKERDLLVKISKGFLGAPYRFGGVSLKGLDCSAFVKRVYSIFDINLPRTAREQAQLGQKISRNNLAVGDLVFFNTRRYHVFSHVGIYIGNGEFVHAAAGRAREVRVDSLDQPYYNKRFVRAVRIKELEEKL